MKLKIELELDNAAFGDDGDYRTEVERLLTSVGPRLPLPAYVGPDIPLYDSNGNRVGYARIMQGKATI